MKRMAEASPRFKARIAGTVEALEGLTSTFSEVIVLNRLVVHGDPAATATDARYLLSGPDRHCSF